MKSLPLTLSLAIATLLATISANAAEQVDKTATLAADSKLDIRVQRGDVTITSWDKAEVAIKGTLDELSQGLVFSQNGSNFVIEDKMPRRYSSDNEKGSSLQITLPAKVTVKIKGVSASYQLRNLQGEINSATISGDLVGQKLQGTLALKTVSGNITSRDNSGDISLETVSGNIDDSASLGKVSYQLVSGDLQSSTQAPNVNAELVSGEADMQLKSVENLSLRSISGDIKLKLDNIITKAQIDSVSSDIKVHFASKPDAEFSINGGPSGRISNELTDDKPVQSKYMHSEMLNFRTGSGKADVDITTISGDIHLQ